MKFTWRYFVKKASNPGKKENAGMDTATYQFLKKHPQYMDPLTASVVNGNNNVSSKPAWQRGHKGHNPDATDINGYQWDEYGRVIPRLVAARPEQPLAPRPLRSPNSRSNRAYSGWYGMLGNPQLQWMQDSAQDYAWKHGNSLDKAMAIGARSPEFVAPAIALSLAGSSKPVVSASRAVTKPIFNAFSLLSKYKHPAAATAGSFSAGKEYVNSRDTLKALSKGLSSASDIYLMGGANPFVVGSIAGSSGVLSDYSESGNFKESLKSGLSNGGLKGLLSHLYNRYGMLAGYLGGETANSYINNSASEKAFEKAYDDVLKLLQDPRIPINDRKREFKSILNDIKPGDRKAFWGFGMKNGLIDVGNLRR